MGDRKTNYVGDVLGLPNPFNEVNWPSFSGMDLGNYIFGDGRTVHADHELRDRSGQCHKVMGKHELQFGFHSRYDQLNNSRAPIGTARSTSGRMATSLYDPDSTPDDPLAARLHRSSAWPTCISGSSTTTPTFLRPRVSLPPVGIRRVSPGQLEGHATADIELGCGTSTAAHLRQGRHTGRLRPGKRATSSATRSTQYLKQG